MWHSHNVHVVSHPIAAVSSRPFSIEGMATGLDGRSYYFLRHRSSSRRSLNDALRPGTIYDVALHDPRSPRFHSVTAYANSGTGAFVWFRRTALEQTGGSKVYYRARVWHIDERRSERTASASSSSGKYYSARENGTSSRTSGNGFQRFLSASTELLASSGSASTSPHSSTSGSRTSHSGKSQPRRSSPPRRKGESKACIDRIDMLTLSSSGKEPAATESSSSAASARQMQVLNKRDKGRCRRLGGKRRLMLRSLGKSRMRDPGSAATRFAHLEGGSGSDTATTIQRSRSRSRSTLTSVACEVQDPGTDLGPSDSASRR